MVKKTHSDFKRKTLLYILVGRNTLISPSGKEGSVLFNDTLNTLYLRLYGIRLMVKDHSDNKRGNLLPPHRLLFLISSKGSFTCSIPQTG